jgi:hypothetical protein
MSETASSVDQSLAGPIITSSPTFLPQAVVREHGKLMSTVKRQMRQNAPLWMQFFFFAFWCGCSAFFLITSDLVRVAVHWPLTYIGHGGKVLTVELQSAPEGCAQTS